MARESFSFQALGIGPAVEMFDGVSARVNDLRSAQEPIDEVLNAAYRKRFAAWGGWLVESGALRASLTDDGALGALREAHRDEVDFGSSIVYARFHARDLLSVTAQTTEHVADAVASFFAGEDDDLFTVHRRTP